MCTDSKKFVLVTKGNKRAIVRNICGLGILFLEILKFCPPLKLICLRLIFYFR